MPNTEQEQPHEEEEEQPMGVDVIVTTSAEEDVQVLTETSSPQVYNIASYRLR